MPRIKRWFPVNHNINRDPELWAMRREIGEKSLSIWLEFLSIADQNEGEIPGDLESLLRSVAGTCQCSVMKVRLMYDRSVAQLWLSPNPTLHVVKYWNYHRSREPIKPPLGSLLTDPIRSDPKILKKESEPASPEPSVDVKKPEGKPEPKPEQKSVRKMLDPVVKIWADKVYQTDPVRFASLIRWIKQAEKEKFENAVIAAALERFLPYCHTITDWWPYLDKLIYKVKADMSRDRSQSEHDKHKGSPVPQGLLGLVRRIEK